MSFMHPDKYAPDRLQKIALSLMSVMVLMTFTLTNIQAVLWQSSQWLVGAVLPAVVVQLTNAERSDLNAAPLTRNATLDAAARLKAQHMAQNQYFAHYAPDGTSPWYWFDQAGYRYAHAGENLAIHFTDSDEVVEAWMNSPTHRENIVNSRFTEIGVGTAKGMYDGSNTVYVVQLFGTPAAVSAPTPPVATQTPTPTPASTPVPLALAEVSPVVADSGPTVAAVESDVVEPVLVDAAPVAIENNLEITTQTVTTSPLSVPETAIAAVEPASQASPGREPVTASESALALSPNSNFTNPGLESMVSTSSGLAVANSIAAGEQQPISFISLATQPNTVMQLVYTMIALAVFLLLILSFVNEMKHAHPVQMAYSFALLFMMGGLYWLHTTLTQGAIVV